MRKSKFPTSVKADKLYELIFGSEKLKPHISPVLSQLNISIHDIEPKSINDFQTEDSIQEIAELRFNHYQKKRLQKLAEVSKVMLQKYPNESELQDDSNTMSTCDIEAEVQSQLSSEKTKEKRSSLNEMQEKWNKATKLRHKRRQEAADRAVKLIMEHQTHFVEKLKEKEQRTKEHLEMQLEKFNKKQKKLKELELNRKARQGFSSREQSQENYINNSRSISPVNENYHNVSFNTRSKSRLSGDDFDTLIDEKLKQFQIKMDLALQRHQLYNKEKSKTQEKRCYTVMKKREEWDEKRRADEEKTVNALFKLHDSLMQSHYNREEIKKNKKIKLMLDQKKTKSKMILDQQTENWLQIENQMNLKEKKIQDKVEESKMKRMKEVEIKKEKNRLIMNDVIENKRKKEKIDEEKARKIIEEHNKELEELIERKKWMETLDQIARKKENKLILESNKVKTEVSSKMMELHKSLIN
ncbi:unnamed protein product [Blepharisma stoltei]|uniref:Uncharacterized protein n=1 Tax=Blepharisma stoltei TaxID=1481888 RepID=A0AAU9IX89_9CILI|nr:unnamed protein product [Blepharisma stoltei]